MGFMDFVGGMGFPTSFGGGATDFLNPAGATMTDPLSGATTKMGFINPNSTPEGQMLRNQMGTTVDWGGTAADARKLLWDPYQTPQAQAVNWKQAPVTMAKAAQGQAVGGQSAEAQGAQIDTSQANQARANQNALVSSLQGTAAGQGPSVAQEQLRQATAGNISNQASAAQSAHGAARLAALRNASNNQAQIQQTANSQASALRAQEIASAQGALGNVIGTQRAQDAGLAAQQAQLSQQSGQFNAGNQQQMALANMQAANQFGMANLTAQQQANLANAGASNTSSLNYAQQANAGNQATMLANLQAQMGTNQLNMQQAQAYIDAAQRAAAGQSGLAQTAYQGTANYNQNKTQQMQGYAQMGGSMLNNMGGAQAALGMLGI